MVRWREREAGRATDGGQRPAGAARLARVARTGARTRCGGDPCGWMGRQAGQADRARIERAFDQRRCRVAERPPPQSCVPCAERGCAADGRLAAGRKPRTDHAGGQAGSMSEADRARIERAYDSDGAGSHHHRAHGGEGRRAKAISMASSPRCGDPKRRPREREPVRPRAGSALRGAPDQRWWAGNARGYLPAIAVRATLHPGTGQGAGRSARRGKTGDRTNGRCPRERGARRGSTLTVESGGFNDT